jgi:hypothetical protein
MADFPWKRHSAFEESIYSVFRISKPQILVGAKHSRTKFTLEPINYRRECFAPTVRDPSPAISVVYSIENRCNVIVSNCDSESPRFSRGYS